MDDDADKLIAAAMAKLGQGDVPPGRVLKAGESLSPEETKRIVTKVATRCFEIQMVAGFVWLVTVVKLEVMQRELQALAANTGTPPDPEPGEPPR